jgi:trans-2,3-dihydro-3-hydroxyanthranilate isomerase
MDTAAVRALIDGTFNLYLCAIDGETARVRSFMSELAGEDPATGSAAGPLLAYANARLGAERLTVTQGVEMGRPSRLLAEMEDGRPRVGGDVVVLVTGTLRLP